MRAIVTGGAGFVGANLVDRLVDDGYEVIVFDNLSTGKQENINKEAKFFLVDVSHKSYFEDKTMGDILSGVDVIFHLAALARIQPSIKNPKPSIETNFNGTLNVLECAREHNIPVIYAGSSSYHHGLYGSPYAWSKYGGEELCKLYSEVYNLNTTICRFYNVYGKYHIRTGTYATVLGIFEQQYLDGKPLTITSDGEQRRDFTHVDDIVDGLVRCVGKKHEAEIFELGSGVNYSINEVADMFDSEKDYIPARPGEYDKTLCDYSKAQKELGYEPKGDLEKYVKEWREMIK
jgi:nucleoside-diphosphate-sugar epimerase